jgi:hypothetical protein
VSVDTDTGGSRVEFDQVLGSIAYSQGHQSHQMDCRAVAQLAPLAGGKGVAVMRSFTGGVARSIEWRSDGVLRSEVVALPEFGDCAPSTLICRVLEG